MLIIGILLFGMLVGAAAQLLLGTRGHGINWTTAIVAGLLGSIVGGLLISLLVGRRPLAAPERHHRLDRRRDPGDPRLELFSGSPEQGHLTVAAVRSRARAMVASAATAVAAAPIHAAVV